MIGDILVLRIRPSNDAHGRGGPEAGLLKPRVNRVVVQHTVANIFGNKTDLGKKRAALKKKFRAGNIAVEIECRDLVKTLSSGTTFAPANPPWRKIRPRDAGGW